jgi:hypothetical protein
MIFFHYLYVYTYIYIYQHSIEHNFFININNIYVYIDIYINTYSHTNEANSGSLKVIKKDLFNNSRNI